MNEQIRLQFSKAHNKIPAIIVCAPGGLGGGRVIAVFGHGGNDPDMRRRLGTVVSRYADFTM